jgi:hypothetical protein
MCNRLWKLRNVILDSFVIRYHIVMFTVINNENKAKIWNEWNELRLRLLLWIWKSWMKEVAHCTHTNWIQIHRHEVIRRTEHMYTVTMYCTTALHLHPVHWSQYSANTFYIQICMQVNLFQTQNNYYIFSSNTKCGLNSRRGISSIHI